MKLQKPSSLFWSWGAYVFLPINIILGTIISSNGASIEELLISLFLALFIMMVLAYPAVCLSSMYGKNYSQSIRYFWGNRKIANFFIILVPLISIGWDAIQTTMFAKFIQLYIGKETHIFVLLIIGMSYIFALGVTKFEYSWLKNAGIIGMLFLIIVFAANIKLKCDIKYGFIRLNCVLDYTIQILGTWIFSSVTCIMDITSYVKEGKKGFKYIIFATFLTNILLIALGYFINTNIETMAATSIVNLIALLVAIWTTNDSNFYSTMRSLEELGISKIKTVLCVPLISCVLSLLMVEKFETYLIEWLSLMSWVGIPIGIIWWIFYLKEGKV